MKSLKEFSEAYGRRHDAYTRDYHSSVSGMGKRQSAAYHADGGANDEGWDDHKPSHKPADHPHSVHINGKKWKTFGSHSHATNVARKIKGATVHKEEVELEEAVTVDKKNYSWGKMVTVHHGHDTSYPLHPEHQAAIKKLRSGDKTSFKDETGRTVHAHREGDQVHLVHHNTGSSTAKKTTVGYHHFDEGVEIQEDQTTSEYKVKKFVGQDGKTHSRKVRPHKVHFKNSGDNAEPNTDDSVDDKDNMKKEQFELPSFTDYLSPLEESQVDHWKKVQAMDKGSVTGGKEEAKKHLAYLNAVHDYHKKYGNDTKKIKDKIEAINRSRIAEELEEGYVVRYSNPKSEKHGSEKHFDSQESAQKHADRGNSVDKIGGKYTVHKTNAKGHDVKEEVELDEAMTPQQKTDFDRMMAGAMSRAAYNAKWKKPLKSDSKVIYGKNVKEEVAVDEQAPVAPTIDRKYIKGTPEWKAHKEKSKPINGHPTSNPVKEEEMKSYKQFVEALAIQTEEVVEEEVVDEANAFDWKSGGHKTSSRYDIKQDGNRTIVTRKYDPETGHSTGTDEPESTEKRGRGRPTGSKSGAKQKGSGKSNDYRGIPQHSLNLPK